MTREYMLREKQRSRPRFARTALCHG